MVGQRYALDEGTVTRDTEHCEGHARYLDTEHCAGPVPARLKGRCGEEFPLCWSPSSEVKKGWNWIESRSPGVVPPQCESLPSPARLVGIDDVWRAVGAYSRGVPVRGGFL